MSRYLVFLDIDGVFTSDRTWQSSLKHYKESWNVFDPIAISFMNKIWREKKNVEFVITSTWRLGMGDHHHHKHWVTAAFRSCGFEGAFAEEWKTTETGLTRGEQIAEYLKNFGTDVSDFIIFDDIDDEFSKYLGKKRLIKTSSSDGLLVKHMSYATSLIGTWENR